MQYKARRPNTLNNLLHKYWMIFPREWYTIVARNLGSRPVLGWWWVRNVSKGSESRNRIWPVPSIHSSMLDLGSEQCNHLTCFLKRFEMTYLQEASKLFTTVWCYNTQWGTDYRTLCVLCPPSMGRGSFVQCVINRAWEANQCRREWSWSLISQALPKGPKAESWLYWSVRHPNTLEYQWEADEDQSYSYLLENKSHCKSQVDILWFLNQDFLHNSLKKLGLKGERDSSSPHTTLCGQREGFPGRKPVYTQLLFSELYQQWECLEASETWYNDTISFMVLLQDSCAFENSIIGRHYSGEGFQSHYLQARKCFIC